MRLFGAVKNWLTGAEEESGYSHSARICDECGSTSPVHRHHIQAIQFGGSESESNIIVLCEECQEDERKVKCGDSHWNAEEGNAVVKYQIIKNAIELKCRLRITYLTEGRTSKKAKREINPLRMYRDDFSYYGGGSGNRMYLDAFCHLRRAIRTFRVGRIKKITTIS